MNQQITKDESNNNVLTLDGDLTVAESAEIKRQLEQLYNSGGSIVVDHSAAISFDFSYLQLIAAFKIRCKNTGKKFSLTGTTPHEFQNLVSDAGFVNMI